MLTISLSLRRLPLTLLLFVMLVGLVKTAHAQTETILDSFNATNGADGDNPWAGLIFDKAGNLYGTTALGGTGGGFGTVFELSPTANGWQETVLYSFQGEADGKWPYGGVAFDASGNLYGTTFGGGKVTGTTCSSGNVGCGTVFKLSPSGSGEWTKTILHTFLGEEDGEGPIGTPVLDAQGNVYATANEGGTYAGGVAFELLSTGTGWQFKILHTFTGGSDGRTPYSGMVFDRAGNLYGSLQWGGNFTACPNSGCGVIYKLHPKSDGNWSYSALYSFTGGDDGWDPMGGVILDSYGNVYGTAYAAGINGQGTVFKLSRTASGSWPITVLTSFNSTDGQWPEAGVAMDAKGNLYGTTVQGGANQTGGVVFEVSPQPDGTWTQTVLHSFREGADDGEYPISPVVLDSSGTIYGTAEWGGSLGYGVVFEITP